MPKSPFRDAAIERLSSPERLDTLITVTSPAAWLALAAMCVVIGGALVWGFKGRTQDTIAGNGILLRRGGVFEVQSRGTGIISSLAVTAGDQVEEGAIVAHLAQPDLEQSIAQTEARLENLKRHATQSGTLIRGSHEAEIASVAEQLRQMDRTQKDAADQLSYLQERLKAQDEAVRRGLINRDVYQATNQEIARVRESIGSLDTQRKQLDARLATARGQTTQSLYTLDQQIRDEQSQLDLLRQQHDLVSAVRSPFRGRVVELLIERGNLVQAGQPLLAVELPEQQLDCYLFVPLVGKRVQPGMLAHISPAGVSWEEYGYMMARVRSVSEAPLSPTAMNVYLHNSTLVQQFSGQGGAYLVELDVEEDKTFSGFKWTTHSGPPLKFGSGTLLSARITVREQAPITLVVPALRRWFGA